MKCQIIFSKKKNKETIISLVSAEFYNSMVRVKALNKFVVEDILKLIFLFLAKIRLDRPSYFP